jgi:hypothetical protein
VIANSSIIKAFNVSYAARLLTVDMTKDDRKRWLSILSQLSRDHSFQCKGGQDDLSCQGDHKIKLNPQKVKIGL